MSDRFGAVLHAVDDTDTRTKIEVVNLEDKSLGFAVTARGKEGFIMRRVVCEITDRVAITQLRDLLNTYLERTE